MVCLEPEILRGEERGYKIRADCRIGFVQDVMVGCTSRLSYTPMIFLSRMLKAPYSSCT